MAPAVSPDWVARARQLKAAGAYGVSAAEVAAVHAALYPDAAPICTTGCPGAILTAFQMVLRWLRLHHSSTSTTTAVANESQARFHSDDTQYTPMFLGVTYTNANLTDAAARHILKHDPEAQHLFAVLPADEQLQARATAPDATPAEPAVPAEQAAPTTDNARAAVPNVGGVDYDLLAKFLADELLARLQFTPGEEPTEEETEAEADEAAPEAPAAPAAPAASTAADHDDNKPVALSKANKDQLQDMYRSELKQEPAEDLTNDELRKAIADHRTGAGSAAE